MAQCQGPLLSDGKTFFGLHLLYIQQEDFAKISKVPGVQHIGVSRGKGGQGVHPPQVQN